MVPGPYRISNYRAAATLVAFLIVAMRIAGVTHPSFQAAAHLFVGGAFGAWISIWLRAKTRTEKDDAYWPAMVAIGPTLVEAVCFVLTHK